MKVWTSATTLVTPLIGFALRPHVAEPVRSGVSAPPRPVSGFQLIDGRASYGVGLETFALGFPIHFDWSWRTLFNRDWEDVVFAYPAAVDGIVGPNAGSTWFRKAKFASGSATTSKKC